MGITGVLGAMVGALAGPALAPALPFWQTGKIGALFLLCLAIFFYSNGNRIAQKVLFLGALLWVGMHRPAQPSAQPDRYRVLHRYGDHFGSLLLLSGDKRVFSAYGSARPGDLVKVRCRIRTSLVEQKFCVVAGVTVNREEYSKVAARLKNLGPTVSAWMMATVFGKKDGITREQKQIFKSTGLYHLLVVSGFHVSLMASLVKGATLAIFWLSNVLRLIPPSLWTKAVFLANALGLLFVWWFAWFTGLGCPAQRAAICYSLAMFGFRINRLPIGALIQAIVFPCGWLSLSNFLSWGCYLVLLSFNGRSIWQFILQLFCLSLVGWVLLGSFSPLGIFANLFMAPWIIVLILLGVPIMLAPADGLVSFYRDAIILTEDLLGVFSTYSAYSETAMGWERWLGMGLFCTLFVLLLRPCKVDKKLLS